MPRYTWPNCLPEKWKVPEEDCMATHPVVHITLEEYLATDYRPDREWIEGELRERNVGTWEHARVQALLAARLGQHEDEWGVVGTIGQRIRVASNRVRIPDLALLHKGKQPPVVSEPPVLVVEILSPDDSYSDTQERVQDYHSMGIKAVWLVDPRTRTGRMSIGGTPAMSEDAWLLAKVLKVPGTAIHVDLDQLFANAGLWHTPSELARSDYSEPQSRQD
jgi:Uma2 family endonuclease